MSEPIVAQPTAQKMRRRTLKSGMLKRSIALTLITAIGASGCALASERYVAFPGRGQPPDLQYRDRAECEGIAQMYKGSNEGAAAAGALLGVAVGGAAGAAGGAIAGAFNGMAGQGSLAGLAIGGAVGLISGALQASAANQQRYQNIYVACMANRGYTLGG